MTDTFERLKAAMADRYAIERELGQPMFELLGTPPANKRLALFPLGHLPPINETTRETPDWLDKYLGPVGN